MVLLLSDGLRLGSVAAACEAADSMVGCDTGGWMLHIPLMLPTTTQCASCIQVLAFAALFTPLQGCGTRNERAWTPAAQQHLHTCNNIYTPCHQAAQLKFPTNCLPASGRQLSRKLASLCFCHGLEKPWCQTAPAQKWQPRVQYCMEATTAGPSRPAKSSLHLHSRSPVPSRAPQACITKLRRTPTSTNGHNTTQQDGRCVTC